MKAPSQAEGGEPMGAAALGAEEPFPWRRTVAGQLSSGEAQRYLDELEETLTALHLGRKPRSNALAWPAGFDRSILHRLLLTFRTANALRTARLMEGDNALAVRDLLGIRNFGHLSMKNLLFEVEEVLKERAAAGVEASHQASPSPRDAADSAQQGGATASPTAAGPWQGAGNLLRPLFAAAVELRVGATLADALHPDFLRLAARLGLDREMSAIRIENLVEGAIGPLSLMSSRLARTIEAMSATERTIVEERLLRAPPLTLEAIGSRVGLTRERIRQIQVGVERRIGGTMGAERRVLALVLQEQLGSIAPEATVERRLESLLSAASPLVERLLGRALIAEMGFTLRDGFYIDESTRKVIEEVKAHAQELADDVGLVDESELIARLPEGEWRRSWPWLRKQCGLHDLHGSWGIRSTRKARAKAALLSFGRPAARQEIAAVCGLPERRIGAHLSNIPSVVKADKDRWGLGEWIDVPYEGIVEEILRRIEEGGGATTTERCLREIPRQFKVEPNSVRIFMRAPKFVIRDGWIRIADISSLPLRPLDEVIDGRDRGGAPYWTFQVHARFFDGYSVTGMPPEFAEELGCAPDGRERVRIENLPDCPALSVRWPLASINGASLGYLADPLRRLGLRPGERARVRVTGPRLVEVTADRRKG